MNMRQMFLILFLLVFGLMNAGCASFNKKLKGWLGGGGSQNIADAQKPASTLTKFSDSPDVDVGTRRGPHHLRVEEPMVFPSSSFL